MYRILCLCFLLAAVSLGITACEQAADTSSNLEDYANLPTAAKGGGGSTTADPAVVYVTEDYKIAVMDSTGANQTVVYTPPSSNGANSVTTPNWSPGNSIVWTERHSSTSSSIKAADINVSNGVPISSNVRTLASISNSSAPYAQIRNARWSSKASTNQIAFSLFAPAGGRNHICLMSADGGTWDTIYTSPENVTVIALEWKWNDSRIAALMRKTDASGNFSYNYILSLDPGYDYWPGFVLDSTIVGIEMWYPDCPINWSRATSEYNGSDINRLVFAAGSVSNLKLYYRHGNGDPVWTNNVSNAIPGTPVWSPNNSSVMFVRKTTKVNRKTGQYYHELCKNTTGTTTVTTLDTDFPHTFAQLNWHR